MTRTGISLFMLGLFNGGVAGIIVGCLMYSGRHDQKCNCRQCRRGRWMMGDEVDPGIDGKMEWFNDGILGCDLNLTKFGRWADADTHRFPKGSDRCFCGAIDMRRFGPC